MQYKAELRKNLTRPIFNDADEQRHFVEHILAREVLLEDFEVEIEWEVPSA